MESEEEKVQKIREKIKKVERELLDKHRNWTQAKAQWMARMIVS
jgi:hypothetical protein